MLALTFVLLWTISFSWSQSFQLEENTADTSVQISEESEAIRNSFKTVKVNEHRVDSSDTTVDDKINSDSINIHQATEDSLQRSQSISDTSAVDSLIPVPDPTLTLILITLSAENAEPIAGVSLNISGYGPVKSDSDGLAEIQFPVSDSVNITVEDSGKALRQSAFKLPADQELVQLTLNISSREEGQLKKELKDADMVVVAKREPLHERKEVSMKTVNREEMQEVSSTMGDPLRVISTLPGVSNTSDLNVRPYVRGGDEKETRLFWNNIPIIQPFHALSAFSIYNMETVEDVKFYSGGFPVEGNGSLSGALFMNSRPAPLDTVSAMLHASLLRGNSYIGVPVVKDKFGVYFAYQAFLYDWVIKRATDVVKWQMDDPDAEEEIEQWQKYTDLPNFKDLEFGFNYKAHPKVHIEYSALRALDLFRVLDPTEAANDLGDDSTTLIETARKIDTLAVVEIPNWVHGTNILWNVTPNWVMKNTVAFQDQEWFVQFSDDSDGPLFELNRNGFHLRSHNIFQLNNRHLLTFGTGYDYKYQRYHIDLPRIAYEVLVNGNPDLIESIGHFNPEGFAITRSGILSDVSDYADNLFMDYDGKRRQHFSSAYFGDEFKYSNKTKLSGGARLEYENTSGSLFLAPRLSWYQSLDPQTELSVSSGLYSQNEFDFYYRHFNKKLKSEKAWHLNVEWSHDFTPYYGLEIVGYGKYYYDLASIRLKDSDEINTDFLFEALDTFTGYTYSNGGIDSLAAQLGLTAEELRDSLSKYSNAILDILPEEQAQIIRGQITKKYLDFSSTGIGYALGSEVSFKYDPFKAWRGWVSVEASLSKRKDGESEVWYNFRKHRPWSLKWHNYFNFPNKYELAIKANMSAGQAYTGYTNFDQMDEFNENESDTVFVIERKNNRRYGPYTRVDFRLSQRGTIFGLPYSSFFEIWNSFNEPNFILTDSKTGEFKFFEFNFPFPTVFLGYELRW